VSGVDAPRGILAHIRHAEGWLRRARADYERGDGRQVLLRLLLAEAEIRRARESGVAVVAIPRRRSAVPAWAILGAVAAAVALMAVYVMVRPPASSPIANAPGVLPAAQSAEGRGGVLKFESGQVLPFVGIPPQVRPSGRAGPGEVVGADGDSLLDRDGPTLVTFR